MKIDSIPGEDLPPAAYRWERGLGQIQSGKEAQNLYTEDQMRAYALEAVAQERERLAEWLNRNLMSAPEYAEAIRAGNQR